MIQSVKSISECLNVSYKPTQEIYNLCWEYDIELWNRISKDDKKKKRMEKKAEKKEAARLKLKKWFSWHLTFYIHLLNHYVLITDQLLQVHLQLLRWRGHSQV